MDLIYFNNHFKADESHPDGSVIVSIQNFQNTSNSKNTLTSLTANTSSNEKIDTISNVLLPCDNPQLDVADNVHHTNNFNGIFTTIMQGNTPYK